MLNFRSGLPGGDQRAPDDDAVCFVFSGERLLCGVEALDLPQRLGALSALGLHAREPCYMGALDGRGCWACELPEDAEAPAGMAFDSLYRVLMVDEARFALAGRAWQLLQWRRRHRYCGQCGQATHAVPGERAMRCAACDLLDYPRISPCIIVLVSRGEELLLARNANFPTAMFSALAGFVEPGETVEQTVHREVREEVGIAIDAPRYVASQPWPFPHQLMLGFYAEHAVGDLVADGEEIAEAHWYHYSALPDVPPRHSLSGQLIVQRVRQLAAGGAAPPKTEIHLNS